VSLEQDGPGARGSGDGKLVGFVLARSRDIPRHKQFTFEDLKQCMLGLEYLAGAQDSQLTRDNLRALARRFRIASLALSEERGPNEQGFCFQCGRRA
jgi:hypothetical protein